MTQDPCKCESVHAVEEDGTTMGAGSGMQEGSRTDFGPTQSKHAPTNYVKETVASQHGIFYPKENHKVSHTNLPRSLQERNHPGV